jgi:hypothetical protein
MNKHLAATLLAAVIGSPASAASVAVVNATFDSNLNLAPGQWTARGTGFQQAEPIPGWTVVGNDVGIVRPASGWFTAGPYLDGTYAYFGGTGGGGQAISQTLGVIAAGAYSLSVDVGWRSGLEFAGYKLELLADGAVVASNNNGVPFVAADRGSFKRIALDWTAAPFGGQQGQALSIRLSAPTNGPGTQTAFDNVAVNFTATAVPEPESIALMLGGLALLSWRWRRDRQGEAA